MIKIFLDTNILLDYLIENRPNGHAANRIMELVVQEKVKGFLSPISLVNIFYILRTQRTEQERKAMIESFLDLFDIVELDFDIMQLSLFTSIADYEDSVQYICAQKAGVDHILTGDSRFRDYNLDLKRISASDFLKQLEQSIEP